MNESGANADVNIGEFWNGFPSVLPVKQPARRTIKLAASIAHINDQKVTGAKAFTAEPDSGRWQEYPFALKAVGDKAFVKGANLMIIHRYAHQPHPTALPGMTMGPWGIHFDRTNTWWNQSKDEVIYHDVSICKRKACLWPTSFISPVKMPICTPA
jgi:hypothetical protein